MSIAEKLTAIAENEPKVYQAGKKEGYDEGQQAAYDSFWDTYQQNGERTNYALAFGGRGWTNETFKPKYDMYADLCYMMFSRSLITGDLDEILRNCGVTLTLGYSSAGYLFSSSQFSSLGDIDLKTHSLSYTFQDCKKLETIRSVNVSRTSRIVGAFDGCTALKNLTLIGPLKVTGLDVSACPLTHESLMSILNALEAKTSGTFSVTLGTTNLAKLTDAEKAVATEKGWSLA